MLTPTQMTVKSTDDKEVMKKMENLEIQRQREEEPWEPLVYYDQNVLFFFFNVFKIFFFFEKKM